MKLTIIERLTALGLLPKEGNFVTWKIIKNLREALSFSEEELKALQFDETTKPGSLAWRIEGVPAEILNKDVEIGPKATKVISDALEALNKEEKLTEQHYSLYEKFCATEEK